MNDSLPATLFEGVFRQIFGGDKTYSQMAVSAIVDAAEAGHLSLCACLLAMAKTDWSECNLDMGGNTWTDAHGRSPLLAACACGHLHVAQFLVGQLECGQKAWSDAWLLHPSASGATPLSVACEGGHLETVQWLLDIAVDESGSNQRGGSVGPSQKSVFERMLRSVDAYGCSTLSLAAANGHTGVVQLLLLSGAANIGDESSAGDGDEDRTASFEHVDPNVISDDVYDFEAGGSAALIQSLQALQAEHCAFTVLLGAVYKRAPLVSWRSESHASKKNRNSPLHSNPLPLLRGHESTLLRLVSEFAGVVTGRQLRNAREALEILVKRDLAERLVESNGDSDDEQ
mmetsp:Transcript_48032/g.96718  ORF Transcript_48032/g.96718 Transcript_48032/m.96718 type:complete len:343 (-) Transcript_48032:174-1202(-)